MRYNGAMSIYKNLKISCSHEDIKHLKTFSKCLTNARSHIQYINFQRRALR